jgi:hypothetical protein
MSKTHFKKAFNTPYLGSQDLPDYKDLTLTIDKVLCEMSRGLKENSLFNIIYFKEKGFKTMLLNATNSKILKNLTKSPYIEDWSGQRITIYVLEGVKAFGGTTDALRIRTKTVEPTIPVITVDHPKWESICKKVKAGLTIEGIRNHYEISTELFNTIK